MSDNVMSPKAAPLSVEQVRALNRSWVDGCLVEATSRFMQHLNPADASDLGDTCVADAAAVDVAVRSARRCFAESWGRLPGTERKRLLHSFADEVAKHSAELSLLETLEVGRPTSDANQLNGVAAQLVRTYANMIDRVHGDLFDAEDRRLGVVWRRARGVVAAIVPWNVPVMNVLLRVAPALAAGNTIVVKPSENSPRAALFLAQLAAKAGIPDGAFNVVLGSGAEAGNALASHSDVNLVTFTGSSKTGMAIARAAADASLKPVLLECGGKSSQVILEDAFEDPAVWNSIFFSAFWNSGQWCVAKTRMLVPRALQQKAVDGLRAAAAHWNVGDPARAETKLGPLASALQRERVQAYFSVASQLGEVVDLGCARDTIDDRGYYAFPSVVCGLPRGSRMSKEEVFGPLMTVEGFDGIDDAIALANDTEFGLSASIWTNRSDFGFKLARSIEAGGVWVYSSAEAAKQSGPVLGTSRYFEPRKQSGYGVDGGVPGYLVYTSAQSVGFFN
jgi:acyl-CoA reductase-like NAD-dependent aldehyde dehydrogenase